MKIPLLTEAQKEQFWAKVRRGSPDECWPWNGSVAGKGYGYLTFQSQNYYAHVMAYYLTIGIWPSETNILHSCDNPPCCNPSHLFDGTKGDNIRDCVAKGRQGLSNYGAPPGRLHGMTALTEPDVLEIRRLGLLMGPSQIANDPRFKGRISPGGIGYILRRVTWRHI